MGGYRSLHGHASPEVAFVAECDLLILMPGQPEKVLIDHGCVDHQEILGFPGPVGDKVVDHTAIFIEHDRVLAFTRGEFGNIVC